MDPQNFYKNFNLKIADFRAFSSPAYPHNKKCNWYGNKEQKKKMALLMLTIF